MQIRCMRLGLNQFETICNLRGRSPRGFPRKRSAVTRLSPVTVSLICWELLNRCPVWKTCPFLTLHDRQPPSCIFLRAPEVITAL